MKHKSLKGLASVCALAIPLSGVADENKFEIYGSVEARTISRDGVDLDTHVSTARVHE